MSFWNQFNQYSVGYGLGEAFGSFFQNISQACNHAGYGSPVWIPPPNWTPQLSTASSSTEMGSLSSTRGLNQVGSLPSTMNQGFYSAIKRQGMPCTQTGSPMVYQGHVVPSNPLNSSSVSPSCPNKIWDSSVMPDTALVNPECDRTSSRPYRSIEEVQREWDSKLRPNEWESFQNGPIYSYGKEITYELQKYRDFSGCDDVLWDSKPNKNERKWTGRGYIIDTKGNADLLNVQSSSKSSYDNCLSPIVHDEHLQRKCVRFDSTSSLSDESRIKRKVKGSPRMKLKSSPFKMRSVNHFLQKCKSPKLRIHEKASPKKCDNVELHHSCVKSEKFPLRSRITFKQEKAKDIQKKYDNVELRRNLSCVKSGKSPRRRPRITFKKNEESDKSDELVISVKGGQNIENNKRVITVKRLWSNSCSPSTSEEDHVPTKCSVKRQTPDNEVSSSTDVPTRRKRITFNDDNSLQVVINQSPFGQNKSDEKSSYSHQAAVTQSRFKPKKTDDKSTKVSSTAEQVPLPIALKEDSNLRPVVIDGPNIAFCHGKNKSFSVYGIALAVEYFKKIGSYVKVFVPSHRKYFIQGNIDEDLIVYTPSSKKQNGKRVVCYDDRFILEYAQKTGAIVVSNDAFLDLVDENSQWAQIINERVLNYTFADDLFMVPRDPNGRGEPNLDSFLMF